MKRVLISVDSKVMFALQIGSWRQLPTCNVHLDADRPVAQVLLQYTTNKVSLHFIPVLVYFVFSDNTFVQTRQLEVSTI